MRRIVVTCATAALLAFVQPASSADQGSAPAATASAEAAAAPCDQCLEGVINFAKVSDSLWRGSQPTSAGFASLEAAGAKTIVSLRHDFDDYDLLKTTKLRYLRIPMRAWDPRAPDIALFLSIVKDPNNWPVFVHCAQGRDRTGYSVAAYRMINQAWTAERAIEEMVAFRFNKIWLRNRPFLRKLDLEHLRDRVNVAP